VNPIPVTIVLILLLVPALSRAADPASDSKTSWIKRLANGASPSTESPSVAGVRGLDKNSASTASTARDYAAVDRLEAVAVSQKDVDQFVKDGKLK
jgi:hypothetical protein